MLALVVGAIIAAAIVILLVVLGGGSPGPGTIPAPSTFSQAAGEAQSVIASVSGGPWNLSSAYGISATVPFMLNNTDLVLGCNVTGGNFGVDSYPSGSGAYSGGQATVWILSYVSTGAGGGTLWVQVVNGVATELGVTNNSGRCATTGVPGLGPVIDSSVAVEKILATPNGTRFSQAFPKANATYSIGGWPNPTWIISLNGCGRYVAGPGTLLASVWASNATIQNAPREPTTIAC
jgi:hypothetical protein